jgi:iron complex outermembrane receptor protein
VRRTFLLPILLAAGRARAQQYESRVVGEEEPDTVPSTYASTVRPEDDPRAGASVAEALDALPGVRVRSIGGLGSFATVSIRGSTGSQVRVLLDGIPLATSATGVAGIGDLSLDSFAEIRVHRGAAPPSLGGGAIGGVVELVTPEPGRDPRFEASLGAGSFDTLRLSTLEVGRTDGLRYTALAATGYTKGDFSFYDDRETPYDAGDDRTSLRTNDDAREVEGGLSISSAPADRWLLETGGSLFAKEQGLAGRAAFQAGEARLATLRVLAQGTLTRFFDRGSVGLRLQGRAHRDLFDDPAGEIGIGEQRTDDLTRAGAATLLASMRLLPVRISLAAGGEWERFEPEDELGPGAADGRPTRRVAMAALEVDVSLGRRLVLSPLARIRIVEDSYRVVSSAGGDRAVPGDPAARVLFSPRLGARLAASRAATLRASFGRDHREPTFEELFGDRGQLLGNPSLEPESAWSGDLGIALVLRHARLDAGVFQTEADDLIQLVQTSIRTVHPVNLGRTRIRGVEAGASVEGPAGTRASAADTLTDSEILSDIPSQRGNQVPGRPLHDARVVLEERVRWLRAAIDADLLAGNYLDAANRRETPARVFFGATVCVDPAWALGFSLAVSVRNVLDHRVETVPIRPAPPGGPTESPEAVSDYAGFPLPGRSVFALLRFRDPRTPKGATP